MNIEWNIRPFINGRYHDSTSEEQFEDVNPAHESVLCRVAVGSAADINTAVSVARNRFEGRYWAGLPPACRGEILRKLAGLIRLHKSRLARLDTLEMGKPIRYALSDSEELAPLLLESWAGLADKLMGSAAPLSAHSVALNVFEPRGVVGAISAWNFPCVNAVIKLGPALAAGNSIVLKPSEIASGSALKLAELALEAGVPEGVLNVVPGLGRTVGAALASHTDVDVISFTGSTATGRRIMQLAGASNGKPVLLECGGKSPHVVFDDIDNLDKVADAAASAVLWNQGQVCVAHTRVIVHESIRRELLEKVVRRVSNCKSGDPLEPSTEYGPLASAGQRDRVRRYVEQGIKDGADPVVRGAVRESAGCYVSPTIFDRVTSSMSIAQEEIFGPVLCVQSFVTEEEAIKLTNNTEFGLEATVWTRDIGRAKRLAHGLRVGSVSIRTAREEDPDFATVLSSEPRKASGFGAEVGIKGLESYSTLKSVYFLGA